ncbi:hypothetical protein CSB45_06925 [candidate division KSB3 bacterium]|uniref:Transmembrane protein n=1 Tax=candidate division KSB3 bacterium TaxID=2044937 RepID=A0A2G6E664_9BACT|nr:MAG: hypothetical protein CSB45_06925 [candidate division KSB3 bacterium]PIE30032.1 MAG: hypothetical protein CSA57_05670 [candidate division KSB3 bacterium]
MHLFGVTCNTQMLFFLMLIAIGILMLVFFRNRKYNLLMIQAVSKELEAALEPKDQTYTWLGGSVGFTAQYETLKPLRKAEATLTMLSRQSLLFYPISKLMFGNDRLFVVMYPYERCRSEAHVLEQWYYKLRLRSLENESTFHRHSIALQGKTFYIFSSDKAEVEKLSAWMQSIPQAALIKHVALVPKNGTLYLYMIPKLDGITRQTIKHMLSMLNR